MYKFANIKFIKIALVIEVHRRIINFNGIFISRCCHCQKTFRNKYLVATLITPSALLETHVYAFQCFRLLKTRKSEHLTQLRISNP